MAFFAKFWGTRGSIPTPGYQTHVYGGNTSCIEFRVDDALLICDAGSGVRELGLDLVRRGVSPIEGHFFFSHAHWDHIQGFPFFVPAYAQENTFYVYGTRTGDTHFHELLSGQMQSDYFPVGFSDLGATIIPRDLGDGEAEVNGVKVRCFPQIHPGASFGYSFEKSGCKAVYATDNELDQVLTNREATLADTEIPREIPADYVEFVRGASLLIADGQFTDQEYPSKIGFGHPRATTLVDLAIQAEVKQLAITHHDPMHSDDAVEEKLTTCRERAHRLGAAELIVFGAREGVELRLN